jgi:DNA modification methylase
VLAGCAKHLDYWWTIAGVHSGGNQLLQKLGIRCGWKPLIWFVKGTRGDVQNILVDVVTGRREKDIHHWQQAEAEAMYYIEHLTSPRGLVVDFFLGGGTTAVAAQKLGRSWIGFEVDASAAERTSQRLRKTAA